MLRITCVLRYRNFRFRVYPTPVQEARLLAWEGGLRFLWNIANEQRLIGVARTDKRYPTAYDQMSELTDLRAELSWLADVPRNLCGQLLTELDKAWQRCFKRLARAPRWKRKSGDAIGLCEPHPKVWRLDGANVRFPKIGNIRAVIHRPLEGKPKTCTIRRDGDQWFALIVCEIDTSDPAPRVDPVVAIDRGVVNAVADSDGVIVQSPRFFASAMKRLARAQRAVSRRKKGSKNREKAKRKVARIHRKTRRQREHFVHNLSSAYAKSHGTVVVEKLQIGNMARANRGFARGILDAGWGKFVEYVRYKLAWSGGTLVEVPAAYSSQTCNGCGYVAKENRVSQSSFKCVSCGLTEHADLNAALVLKQRFHTPGNPWCQPVEGSPLGAPRSRKRVGVARRHPKPRRQDGVDYSSPPSIT